MGSPCTSNTDDNMSKINVTVPERWATKHMEWWQLCQETVRRISNVASDRAKTVPETFSREQKGRLVLGSSIARTAPSINVWRFPKYKKRVKRDTFRNGRSAVKAKTTGVLTKALIKTLTISNTVSTKRYYERSEASNTEGRQSKGNVKLLKKVFILKVSSLNSRTSYT